MDIARPRPEIVSPYPLQEASPQSGDSEATEKIVVVKIGPMEVAKPNFMIGGYGMRKPSKIVVVPIVMVRLHLVRRGWVGSGAVQVRERGWVVQRRDSWQRPQQ